MSDDLPRVRVFNRQRKLPVPVGALATFLEHLKARLRVEEGFSVVLVSDREMRRLNRRFAGRDYATDVLSFPTDASDRSADPYLGEVFISAETAERQRPGELAVELRLLALHGLLHLLGYDHEVDQGEMAALEGGLKREMELS